MPLVKLEKIKEKRQDLQSTFLAVEKEVLLFQNEIALDYIFHNDNHRDYDKQLRKNALRVRLKNAVMQVWS